MNEDILYGAGSDDFRGYVWKIPELSTLLGFRREISADEWMAHEWTGACGEFLDRQNLISVHLLRTPAYAESQFATRYMPLQIDTPLCRLNGEFNDRNVLCMHADLICCVIRTQVHCECCCNTSITTPHCHSRHRTPRVLAQPDTRFACSSSTIRNTTRDKKVRRT